MLKNIFYLIFTIILVFSIGNAQEKVEYLVDDNLLTVNIENLYANCCSAFILDYHINYNRNLITFTITDTTVQKCQCNCNFDISIKIGPLPQGKYTIQLYKEELAKYSYPRDRRINLGRKDTYVNDPHPKSPLQVDFKQSPCKNSTEEHTNEASIKNGLEIYPNTATSSVSVRFNMKESGNINVKILNFLGKEIKDYQFKNMKSGANTIHLDFNDMPPGMYICRIMQSNEQLHRFKLVWSK